MKQILLIGKTGAGKSSLGNLLVKPDGEFVTSNNSMSCTKKAMTVESKSNGVRVTDTAGLLDTNESPEITKAKLIDAVGAHGIRCIFLVVQFGRFTDADLGAVQDLIETTLGPECYHHLVLVMTHVQPKSLVTSQVRMTKWLDEQLSKPGDVTNQFTKIYEICQRRVVLVDNPPRDSDPMLEASLAELRQRSREKLFEMIASLASDKIYLQESARRVQRAYQRKLKQAEIEAQQKVLAREKEIREREEAAKLAEIELKRQELARREAEAAHARAALYTATQNYDSDDGCKIL